MTIYFMKPQQRWQMWYRHWNNFCCVHRPSSLYIHTISIPNTCHNMSCQPKFGKKISNYLLFTCYKYVMFGHPKGHRPTYLIVITADYLTPNSSQTRIWCGIWTWINQVAAIELNMLAIIWRQQCILFFCVISSIFWEIARLWSIIIDKFSFCT